MFCTAPEHLLGPQLAHGIADADLTAYQSAPTFIWTSAEQARRCTTEAGTLGRATGPHTQTPRRPATGRRRRGRQPRTMEIPVTTTWERRPLARLFA